MMRRDLEFGFVMFSTLMMLVVLMGLTLSLMQAVSLYIKADGQLNRQHDALYQLEAQAARFASLLAVSPLPSSCILKGDDPNEAIQQLEQHRGCLRSSADQAYRLGIQDLGVFPCLLIKEDGQVFSSHHWIITIRRLAEPISVLQTRYVRPSPMMVCHDEEITTIQPGALSWRHLWAHS